MRTTRASHADEPHATTRVTASQWRVGQRRVGQRRVGRNGKCCKQGLDGQRAAPLRSIVHEDMRGSPLSRRLLDQLDGFLPHTRLRLYDAIVGGVAFDRVCKGQPQRSQEPKDGEGGGECARQAQMLFGQRRHGGPMIVYVSDRMSAKDVVIARAEDGGRSHFDRIGGAGWQLSEKLIELPEKDIRIEPPALKFEDEGAECLAQAIQGGLQDKIAKGPDIEKTRIGFASLRAVSRKVGIGGDGDLFPHLLTKSERVRHLFGVVGELLGAGRAIK